MASSYPRSGNMSKDRPVRENHRHRVPNLRVVLGGLRTSSMARRAILGLSAVLIVLALPCAWLGGYLRERQLTGSGGGAADTRR